MRVISIGSALNANVIHRRDGCVLKLSGTINESFEGRKILSAVRGDVVFDMGEVNRITSYGVREWMGMLRQLHGRYVGFIHCKPAIVAQFNMITGFGCGGQLISLYAPYVCARCGAESELLIDLRRDAGMIENFALPERRCEACGGESEFDDLPEAYFSFFSGTSAPTPPRHVERMIDDPSAPESAFRVEKEVCGALTVLRFIGAMEGRSASRRVADGLEGTVMLDLTELSSASDDAVEKLRGLAQIPDVRLLVRAVPPSMWRVFEGTSEAGVLSARVPLRCDRCGATSWATVTDARAEAPTAACASCGGTCQFDRSEMDEARLRALHFVEPPTTVQQYLSFKPPPQSDGEEADLGRYKLLRRVGIGGMAEVFLARQIGPDGFDRNVALKRILPSHTTDEVFVKMFQQEARLAARLSHPNIVQVYEHGKVGDQHFIAMEFVRGWDLRHLLTTLRQREQWMPVDLACFIVSQVCGALAAAHEYRDESGEVAPIVHRDVSPHNVLISDAGLVKLTDFGIAKARDASNELTDAGAIKGKLPYLSPELLTQRGQGLDPRQDVYAAGLLLYDCLVHDHPFRRESSVSTMMAVLWSSPQRPSEKRPEVSPALDDIVMRSIHRDPDTRYGSARAFGEAVEHFMIRQGMHTRARDLSTWLGSLLGGVTVSVGDVTTPSLESDRFAAVTRSLSLPGAGAQRSAMDPPRTR